MYVWHKVNVCYKSKAEAGPIGTAIMVLSLATLTFDDQNVCLLLHLALAIYKMWCSRV